MYRYIGLGLGLIFLLVIIYFSFNWSNEFAACIYDHISQKSFIIVNEPQVISDIQKSLNEGNGLYHIKGDKLYKRKASHKQKSNKCQSKILFEKYDDIRIELLEDYPCNSKT